MTNGYWSLNDDLFRVRQVSRDSTGYVWGVEAQAVCPGATVVQGSKRAAYWADQFGIASHEVLVEASASLTVSIGAYNDAHIEPFAVA